MAQTQSATPFTVYIMQAAHTDIGYTHPQEQIALMYLEHYDRVLELCRQTEQAPEAHRFKWTCETFWQVQHYLTHRPEREADFLHFVRNGQIELMAGYLHFTDLIDADAYRRSIQIAVDYCRAHDLPLRCLMHADINGWPWAIADILAQFGIPYFMSHVHIDSGTDPLGKRGSVHYMWTREWGDALRANVPVRTPQAFWWQGPQGGKVLHFLNEHYLMGNVLGLSSNHPFGADKTRYFLETDRKTAGDLYDIALQEVPRYIQRLCDDGYPHDSLLINTGGFYIDNSPPDDRWLQIIARWNAEHDDIQLRTATPSEWLDCLMATVHVDLPARQVAWPDHWAHGLGSMTANMAQARRTQRRRASAIAVVEAAHSKPAEQALDVALEQERLALEHTFCAWSTTAWPAAPVNQFQQITKELTFHRAEMYYDEAIGKGLRKLTSRASDGAPRLYAFAGEGEAGGLRTLHFDGGDMRIDPDKHMLEAADGRRSAIQRDRDDLPNFVAVVPLNQAGLNAFKLVERDAAPAHNDEVNAAELSSAGWRLSADPTTACLTRLQDAAGVEWVDASATYGFGQMVHEVVVHPLGRAATSNAGRLIALDAVSETWRQRWVDVPVYARSTPSQVEFLGVSRGEVFDAIRFEAANERLGRARVSWRLYHAAPIVEQAIEWDKLWCDEPEAAYVAFPFAGATKLALETGGGFFTPGSHDAGGQLPGTCSSYYTVQRAARIAKDDNATLLWLPVDAPLVMLNEIDYNRWETEPFAWNGFLASMPVNHYWHTNFPTSQRGKIHLRYRWASAGIAGDALNAALPLSALGWR